MSDQIHFGTDGWRARIGEGYTFANLRRVAAAAARYYRDECGGAEHGIVIGHDQRFLAREMAEAAAVVVAAHGVPVHLTRSATPTPVISFSVGARGACGAINLTASHNPPTDLGFKVRDKNGAALAPDALAMLEARIPAPGEAVADDVPSFEAAVADGRIQIFDPAPAYRAYVAERVDLGRIADAGLRVAYDPMWGAGIGWLEWLLGPGAQTQLMTIHGERNPSFPEMRRPEPIPPNTDALARHVRATGADIGIANDGDADRVGAVDEHGNFINQLQVYGLLAYWLLEVRGERGAIVKTLSTTSMLDVLGQVYGVPVHETGVGFKYVGPKMLETDAMIGGEESGGFAFRGLPERDGLLVALALMELMLETGKTPSELIRALYDTVGAEWYYDRDDVRFDAAARQEIQQRLAEAAPTELAGLPVTRIDRTEGHKFWLPDDGWLLIRFSGTEPLMRVYTETTHGHLVRPLLNAGLALAGLGPQGFAAMEAATAKNGAAG
jgi:phosphomannomutase